MRVRGGGGPITDYVADVIRECPLMLPKLFVCLQERAGFGPAGAAHAGERDGGAGELQHVGEPLGHRAPLLRLHPTTGEC